MRIHLVSRCDVDRTDCPFGFVFQGCVDQSFIVTGELGDASVVRCGSCGSSLADWQTFVAEVTQTPDRLGSCTLRHAPIAVTCTATEHAGV